MSKRLFSPDIICSDAFTGMSFESQALYIQLNFEADDDGVVNAPQKIARSLGVSEKSLSELVKKNFILEAQDGVVIIKHWRVHNKIRKDRYKPTKYQDALKALYIKPDGTYTKDRKQGRKLTVVLATKCQPNDTQKTTTGTPKSSQVKSSYIDINNKTYSSSSSSIGVKIVDLLRDDEFEKLKSSVGEKDLLPLLDRLNEVDATTVNHPMSYCKKVAQDMGVWREIC